VAHRHERTLGSGPPAGTGRCGKLICHPGWYREAQEDLITHPDNTFYGHARVLAEYAGLAPRVPPIWGHVQHGWAAEYALSVPPRLVGWIPKLVFSQANVDATRARGVDRVEAIGDPFCYLVRTRAEAIAQPRPRSTIVYPLHGWERDDVIGSHDHLIAAVQERESRPVTVCLYWREFDQPEVRRRYEEAGLRVICHGYRHDPQFLHRQFAELLRHDRVVTNRASTALWRGALLGLEAEIYGPVFGIGDPGEGAAYGAFQLERWPELCSGGLDGAAAAALASVELGDAFVREPDELRQLLGWEGRRLRFGPAARVAVRAEFQARRVVYNVRMRAPGGSSLPRS